MKLKLMNPLSSLARCSPYGKQKRGIIARFILPGVSGYFSRSTPLKVCSRGLRTEWVVGYCVCR